MASCLQRTDYHFFGTSTFMFTAVFSQAMLRLAVVLPSAMSPTPTVTVSTFSVSFCGLTLKLAASLALSYRWVYPPIDTSLYRLTVHSLAPGQVKIRYSPFGTACPSTFTSSENETRVPAFAPVRQILP